MIQSYVDGLMVLKLRVHLNLPTAQGLLLHLLSQNRYHQSPAGRVQDHKVNLYVVYLTNNVQ